MLALLLLVSGCSLDPITSLYDESTGPFTERVGPYTRLTFNPGPDWYPSWSSDGTRIAYAARGFEARTQGHMTVNVIPWQGGISQRVSPIFSRIDYNLFPFWMEGDAKIGYISFQGLDFTAPLEPAFTVVDVADREDFTETRLDFHSPLAVSLSPDGSSLVYCDFIELQFFPGEQEPRSDEDIPIRRESMPGPTYLWIVDYPVSGQPRKMPGTEGARGFSWSPDSDSLVFAKDESLYIIAAEGGAARMLAQGTSPAWSPDGAKIACAIDANVFIYELNDGVNAQVTWDGGEEPAWSPDGEKLAFSWARNGNYDIYVVELSDLGGPL
jgi:Tol biopolymer transport system component